MEDNHDQADDQADTTDQLYAEHMAKLEARKIPVSKEIRAVAERIGAVVDPFLDYRHPVSRLRENGLENVRWRMKLVRRAANGLTTDLGWLSELTSELKSLRGAIARLPLFGRLDLEAVASELALLEAEACPDEQP